MGRLPPSWRRRCGWWRMRSCARSLLRQGRFDEAATLLRRALAVALDNDSSAAAFRAWNNLGVALESEARFLENYEFTAPSREMARRKGDRANELAAIVGSMTTLVALGRWDEAIAFAEEAQAAE